MTEILTFSQKRGDLDISTNPSQIIDALQSAAQPGLEDLDDETLASLTYHTSNLVEAHGHTAHSEYNRYVETEYRGLNLDDARIREHLAGKRILVTGGTGLIGSALMQEISRFNPGRLVSFSRGETPIYQFVPGAEYQYGDMRDKERLSEIVEEVKPDIIYHLAADKYNHLAEKRVAHTLSTNIYGTENLIEVADELGVPQIIYASTGKATRPYSPDTYASSKKAGEWLMSQAARKTALLCSAVRFTHVVDDSNIRKRIDQWIANDQPISLQGPDVWFYIQSAKESAHLLLNAGLEAKQGTLTTQAIRNLGMPVRLLDLGVGALVKYQKIVPIYFKGTEAGYEDKAWPGLYDPMSAGDISPLINSLESADVESSKSCPEIDSFPLEISHTPQVEESFNKLKQACFNSDQTGELREMNHDLSWSILNAQLELMPVHALKRVATRVARQLESQSDLTDEHIKINEAIVAAHLALNNNRAF